MTLEEGWERAIGEDKSFKFWITFEVNRSTAIGINFIDHQVQIAGWYFVIQFVQNISKNLHTQKNTLKFDTQSICS